MATYDNPTFNFEMSMDFGLWTTHEMPMADPISRPPSARAQMLYGIGAGTNHHLNTLHNPVYFSDSLEIVGQHLGTNIFCNDRKSQDMAFSSYGMGVPQEGYRHDSPRSESSSQSGDTFSASSHTDDLNTQVLQHRLSISSPSMMQEPYFTQSYSTQAHSPQLPPSLGGGISLDVVQNFEDHVLEFRDSAYSEPDAEGESDHEYAAPTVSVVKRSPRHERQERYYRPSIPESVQDSMSDDFEHEEEAEDGDYNPRRAMASRSRRVPVTRRLSQGRRGSNNVSAGRVTKPKTRKPITAGLARPFPCLLAQYGCIATFTSKNEWKRHVSTQHIKLGFWRCDMCSIGDPIAPTHNDFNRKDLFTQHLRRMHRTHPLTAGTFRNDDGEEEISESAILAHQKRCYIVLRANPERSTCLFTGCDKTFHGEGSWEERVEHVGTHMEKDRKAIRPVVACEEWHEDVKLRDYLEEEGLIHYNEGTWAIGEGGARQI